MVPGAGWCHLQDRCLILIIVEFKMEEKPGVAERRLGEKVGG